MSEFIENTKLYLMKYFTDLQFTIDIACQSIIEKRKIQELDYLSLEQRYIQEFIGVLKIIENRSMDKLNQFFLEQAKRNLNLNTEKLNQEEILFQAGCGSVIYVECNELFKDCQNQFPIGVFIQSLFRLNQNQTDFIRLQILDLSKSKNITIVLDKVGLDLISFFCQI